MIHKIFKPFIDNLFSNDDLGREVVVDLQEEEDNNEIESEEVSE